MHFSTLALSVLASTAYWMPAVALVTRDEDSYLFGMSKPHQHLVLDLEDYEARHNGSVTLERRLDVKACGKYLKTVSDCIGAGASVAGLGVAMKALAVGLKGASNNNDCTTHTGSADNFSFKYYATGRNCDTTAQLDTIQGALDEFVESTSGKNVCGVSCIKLTHGGTWEGYVTLAGPGYSPSTYYCGSSSAFGNCVSGGNGDVTDNPTPA